MKGPTIRIVLCRNDEQRSYYYQEMLDRVRASGYDYKTPAPPSKWEITQGEDKYIFLTCDQTEKMQTLKIAGWDEVGDVVNHPDYDNAIEILDTRVI